MKQVRLPSGEMVPALGIGTWRIGDDSRTRAEEIATIRMALDLGAKLIDTAEMYGEGRAEALIAEAIRGRRDEAFVVSKVYPHNASRKGAVAACERSLERLGTDRLDLYLLHWRGSIPLAETMEAFITLQTSGKIRYYGVSNFDVGDMEELWSVPGGCAVATNQVLYNLTRRGVEWELLPWQRKHSIPIMAYSPVEQGRLIENRNVVEFARRNKMTTSQVALAWLLANDNVIIIPKTGRRDRLKDNVGAMERALTKLQLAELDRLFPPPKGPHSLEML